MRVPRIYQHTDIDSGSTVELDQAAYHHLTRVLRFKENSQIILFNGNGGEFTGTLHIEGKKAFVSVGQFHDIERESILDITLLQGVSKGERMDISIQKAVELGVRKIAPVICQRTVVNLKSDRRDKKMQHWRGIIINACEQSGRNFIPELMPLIKLDDLLNKRLDGLKVIMDPDAGSHLNQIDNTGDRISLLIGPEGGLTDDEIRKAKNADFRGMQLGPRILRTETAALAAISALQTKWGDFR